MTSSKGCFSRVIAVAAAAAVAVGASASAALIACLKPDSASSAEPSAPVSSAKSELEASSDPLDLSVTTDGEGQAAFAFTVKQLAARCNYAAKESSLSLRLTDPDGWDKLTETAPLSTKALTCVCYCADSTIWSLPTLTVFTSGGGVEAIALNLDDHGYQESIREEFEDISRTVIVAVLGLNDSQVSKVYSALYSSAENDYFGTKTCIVPKQMYRSGQVGLYGYFGAGSANICIVPLTDEAAADLAANGCEVSDVKSLF